MLSYILSALSVARHAVALTLVASAAATTMVAGSVDQVGTQSQHETAPMTSTAPTTKPESTAKSEVTLTVVSKTEAPQTSPKLTTQESSPKLATPETSPKPEPKTNDIEALVKDCLTKYAALKASTTEGSGASEACRRAIEASGLTSTEFWTRFAPKAEPTAATVKPSTDPISIEALAKYCVAKYTAAKNDATLAAVASEVCRRAIEASGLTSTAFWARFAPKTEPTSSPVKPSTDPASIEALAKYCITKYEAAKDSTTAATLASEVCRRAIEASGLSATELWAKFGKPQAPKSEPKPTPTPAATALTQLTRYCLTLHAALTTASTHEQTERTTTVCHQAIAESKLTPTQFWTKFSASH